MRRREFVTSSCALVVTGIRPVQSQSLRNIGVLLGTANDAEGQARLVAFKQALEQIGWVDGKNVTIDVHWISSDKTAARAQAQKLSENAEVILAANTISVETLRTVTEKPIIFVSVFDPVHSGFINNVRRPGSNITGFTNHEPSMGYKWIEHLSGISPNISSIGLMFNATTAPMTEGFFANFLKPAGLRLGVSTRLVRVQDASEIDGIFHDAAKARGGLAMMADPFTTNHRKHIVDTAIRYSVPTAYPWTFFVKIGGLFSFGVDLIDIFRRAASYVDRVLKGQTPGELPVQSPSKFELAVNLKTAASMGLTVPERITVLADTVIE